MSEYFKAIKDKQRGLAANLLTSCGYSLETKDNLQKSHVEGIFENDAASRGFVVEKRGSEIKDKLQVMFNNEMVETNGHQAILNTIPTQIGVAPNGDTSKEFYYIVDGWDEAIGDLPACYTYEQMDACEVKEEKVDNYGHFGEKDIEVSSPSDTPKQKLMRDYNESLRRYAEGKKELKMLQTMLSDFDNSKLYKLTVREAAMLGF